jgi:hypothetical protein
VEVTEFLVATKRSLIWPAPALSAGIAGARNQAFAQLYRFIAEKYTNVASQRLAIVRLADRAALDRGYALRTSKGSQSRSWLSWRR